MQKDMSSILRSETLKVTCPKHPTQVVHSICLQQGCSNPYICAHCEAEHSEDHSLVVRSLANVYAEVLNFDFSLRNIESLRDEMNMIMQNVEINLRKTICETVRMIRESFERLIAEVGRRKDLITNFEQIKGASKNIPDDKHLRELVESYRLLMRDYYEPLDFKLNGLLSDFKEETSSFLEKAQNDLFSSLKTFPNFEEYNFSQPKVKEIVKIPHSNGVGYEALTYIDKWNLIAFGCNHEFKYSVGLYDLDARTTTTIIPNVHNRTINNVVWIDHKNYLLTGSNDSFIRIFRASDQGRTLQAIHTFRGHTDCVRYIKYIHDENVLLSIGYDANIRLWNIDNFKRCATIHTSSEGNMSGSIAYIKADRLVGVPFQSGYIRFYHLGDRSLVFELHIGVFHRISLCGLQYLPHRKLIITNAPNAELKMWQYKEGERRVGKETSVTTKDIPYCIVTNSDESQLIYHVLKQENPCLEIYNFHTNKTSIIELPSEIRSANCLISLGERKLASGDLHSSNICILASSTHKNR